MHDAWQELSAYERTNKPEKEALWNRKKYQDVRYVHMEIGPIHTRWEKHVLVHAIAS
jgi:hypothetical protein